MAAPRLPPTSCRGLRVNTGLLFSAVWRDHSISSQKSQEGPRHRDPVIHGTCPARGYLTQRRKLSEPKGNPTASAGRRNEQQGSQLFV